MSRREFPSQGTPLRTQLGAGGCWSPRLRAETHGPEVRHIEGLGNPGRGGDRCLSICDKRHGWAACQIESSRETKAGGEQTSAPGSCLLLSGKCFRSETQAFEVSSPQSFTFWPHTWRGSPRPRSQPPSACPTPLPTWAPPTGWALACPGQQEVPEGPREQPQGGVYLGSRCCR